MKSEKKKPPQFVDRDTGAAENAPPFRDLPDMAALIEEARKLGPMTDEQRREQAASFAFGNLALTQEWVGKSAPELASLRAMCRRMAGCDLVTPGEVETSPKESLAADEHPQIARIWKFEIPIMNASEVVMPGGARILSVGEQDGGLVLWARIPNPDAPKVSRGLLIFGTGWSVPWDEKEVTFLGTVQMKARGLVWHIFEERRG